MESKKLGKIMNEIIRGTTKLDEIYRKVMNGTSHDFSEKGLLRQEVQYRATW